MKVFTHSINASMEPLSFPTITVEFIVTSGPSMTTWLEDVENVAAAMVTIGRAMGDAEVYENEALRWFREQVKGDDNG